ncbi:MAG: PadR family transcriptional regulator [Propionibacteriaceae bacterium]|nr:PadR family transcriptional regulator [Propionibacteriaceae bacterium]
MARDDGWAPQLRKGLVELAILGLLRQRARYGSQLVDDLAGYPALAVTAGTVYPLLARLARSGWVVTSWQESPVGPPRKYYALTAAGRARLDSMATAFGAVRDAVTSILEEPR